MAKANLTILRWTQNYPSLTLKISNELTIRKDYFKKLIINDLERIYLKPYQKEVTHIRNGTSTIYTVKT